MNMALFVVHIGQAIALWVLGGRNMISLPVVYGGLNGRPGLNSTSHQIFNIMPIYPILVSASFATMSAFAHLWTFTHMDEYKENLKRERNWYRTAEYSISAATMLISICPLIGVNDVFAIIGFVGLTTAMILFGDLSEIIAHQLNDQLKVKNALLGGFSREAVKRLEHKLIKDQLEFFHTDRGFHVELWLEERQSLISKRFKNFGLDETDGLKNFDYFENIIKVFHDFLLQGVMEEDNRPWLRVRAFWYGCIGVVVPWISIFAAFFHQLSRVGNAPWFVYTIIFGVFGQFCCFALVHYWYLTGKISYREGEVWYGLFSLLAKSWLSWFAFTGLVLQ
jgi:hypothetical protein